MDAWTIFGAVKLFLDIIDGGPKAAVKGVLMSGVPGHEILDAGEVAYGLFNLNGDYQGNTIVRKDQYVSLSSVKLLERDRLTVSLSELNFPKLAQLQFIKMREREFPKL